MLQLQVGRGRTPPPAIQWCRRQTDLDGPCRGRITRLLKSGPHETLVVAYPSDLDVLCVAGHGFQSRDNGTVEMLGAAVRLLYEEGRPLPHFDDIGIHIGDADGRCNPLAYNVGLGCGVPDPRVSRPASRAIPDFTLLRWPEEHYFKNFTQVVTGLRNASRSPPETAFCGFAGKPSHPQRFAMFQQARKLPDLFEIFNAEETWKLLTHEEQLARMTEQGCTGQQDCRAAPRLSLEEQVARWACLVDVRGAGYSGRVPMLLHAGRPLLLVARQHRDTEVPMDNVWYAPKLVPWVHYIPVAADLHDLEANARWVQQNWAAAQRIAQNAQDFAQSNLSTEVAIGDLAEKLLAAARERAAAGASRTTAR